MFLDFFDLREQPFGVTPDPAYLYPTRTHCEALDSLTEGILSGRGFLALIAEPGLGKTTLLYQVLEGLRDTARAVFLFQTQCNSREFFQYLLSELGVDSSGMGLVTMHTKLNEMLFAEMLAGRRFVLIVDEAQNLDDGVLETIRLLSNFETSNTKLIQIVLAGQPELGEKLAQKRMVQLLQRITVVKQLDALSPEETAGYIRHRLKVAGHCGEELFEPAALALVADRSQGVPRNINRICFNALLEAHAQGCHTVSAEIVERANRKLGVVAASRSTSTFAPLPTPAGTGSEQGAGTPATLQPRQKTLAKFHLRGWGLRMGVLLVVLLAAGLALPRHLLSETTQIMREQLAQRLITPLRQWGHNSGGARARFADFSRSLTGRPESQTPGLRESVQNAGIVEPQRSQPGVPNVIAIQASSAASDARVVILLDNPVQFDSAQITSPDRIYFDLHNARLGAAVGQKTVPSDDGLLKSVRAAQNRDDVVRLVLDADGAKDYSAQLLSDPYRLVIDVHAQATATPQVALGPDAARQDVGKSPVLTDSNHEGQLSLARELGLKISRIAIDPGHGGYDTGTVGPHGLLEKNLCLDVALRLGQLIDENIASAEVVYTRKDDRHVSLEERTAIANNANADLFISIHANSSDDREARGVETFYLSLATSQESMELARRENVFAESSLHDLPDLLQKITRNDKITESKQLAVDLQTALSERLELVNRHETNRGVKQAPFVVLTGARMPAVLSEISFVSNASDANLLLDAKQRERIAEGLYRGIAAYLDSLHSLPLKKRKLVSENRPGTSPGLVTSAAAIERNPQ
jgi:N-acetylmuramoyl-L-alanine amidase/type II secretory pathway predicted ATPase ExeA